MNLLKALRLPNSPTIAFVGAGGKTTALFQLAHLFDGPVIVTATTHLGAWQVSLADRHIIAATPSPVEAIEHNLHGVILVTGEIKGDRTQPLDEHTLIWLREFCGYYSLPLLIEADGARQKPLKAPAEHEPSIPDFVQQVIQVIGLTGLGKALDAKHAHRADVFSQLSGLEIGDNITADAIIRMIKHPLGGLKNIPQQARRVILLNQADTPALQAQADDIAKKLLSAFDSVLIASLLEEKVHAVREPIKGIILAAGESTRFGQPKQLLNWRGEPFVRAVVKTAMDAGLSPVIVVTGAHAEDVSVAVEGLSVEVVHNKKWQSGQASSLKTGLNPKSERHNSANLVGGAAIFLLADQPQITPTLLRALMDKHATTLSPIIAPLVIDQRANPVLFDMVTFKDLMQLEGDVGGRSIFSKHPIQYIPWHDDAMLLDVDTPEQYQRLKDLLE